MAAMIPYGLALRQFPVMVECPKRIFALRHTATIPCVTLRTHCSPHSGPCYAPHHSCNPGPRLAFAVFQYPIELIEQWHRHVGDGSGRVGLLRRTLQTSDLVPRWANIPVGTLGHWRPIRSPSYSSRAYLGGNSPHFNRNSQTGADR